MINRFFNVCLRPDPIWNFSHHSRTQQNILKILHQFTEKVIKERRSKLAGMMNNNSIESIDDIGIKQKRAFIDILLNSTIDGKPLSDMDIREEVDTFMFEVNWFFVDRVSRCYRLQLFSMYVEKGHDTTTSCILFALYNIAKKPEVQRKCFDEIKQIFGNDKTKRAQMSDLNNLHYLDLVIKETLRYMDVVQSQ